MKGFRFHDLRHTFRTQGAEAGVPLEVMMAQLGHMDRQTSLDYVHIQQRALERAKQLIEAEQAEILASTNVSEGNERLLEADSNRVAMPSTRRFTAQADSRIETREAAQNPTAVGQAPFLKAQ